jgi:hypothetical protein
LAFARGRRALIYSPATMRSFGLEHRPARWGEAIMRKIVRAGLAVAAFALVAPSALAMGGAGLFSYEASPYAIWEPQTVVPPALEAGRKDAQDKADQRREPSPPPQARPDQKRQ